MMRAMGAQTESCPNACDLVTAPSSASRLMIMTVTESKTAPTIALSPQIPTSRMPTVTNLAMLATPALRSPTMNKRTPTVMEQATRATRTMTATASQMLRTTAQRSRIRRRRIATEPTTVGMPAIRMTTTTVCWTFRTTAADRQRRSGNHPRRRMRRRPRQRPRR